MNLRIDRSYKKSSVIGLIYTNTDRARIVAVAVI